MAKILNVNTGDYTVRVTSGQTITLDTGAGVGKVVATGNLEVQGTQTTVNSATLDIKDNIITVNSGETGAGVTLNTAGLQVDRGTNQDAFMIFDELTYHNDPITQTNKPGTFVFKDGSEAIRGIKTNAITTGGGDLHLINAGTGVVSVSGTNNYEDQVTDDDTLTNKKYVDDAIIIGIQNINIQKIQRGDSILNIFDQSIDGGVSALKITVDGREVALFRNDSTEIENILIRDDTITTTASSGDLTLSSNTSPFVKIDSALKLPNIDDSTNYSYSPTDILVYSKDPDIGNTGLWYKNKNDYEDELISTNKSLLFSMLF